MYSMCQKTAVLQELQNPFLMVFPRKVEMYPLYPVFGAVHIASLMHARFDKSSIAAITIHTLLLYKKNAESPPLSPVLAQW